MQYDLFAGAICQVFFFLLLSTRPGVYTLQVQVIDKFGCASSCTIVITVIDARVPGATNKEYLCHNEERSSISVNSVEAHLGRHATDRLGDCNILPVTSRPADAVTRDWNVSVLGNPSSAYFTLNITTQRSENITLQVMDLSGRVLNEINSVKAGTVTFADRLRPGMYLVDVRQGKAQDLRLVKQ
jgi:hypothetical protein